MAKQYKVIYNEFNKLNCPNIIGEIFKRQPGYAKTTIAYVNPYAWDDVPEIKEDED